MSLVTILIVALNDIKMKPQHEIKLQESVLELCPFTMRSRKKFQKRTVMATHKNSFENSC